MLVYDFGKANRKREKQRGKKEKKQQGEVSTTNV